ncbi:MAG: peptidylprolyl isomerase [Candidatus Aminicenantaceae bacterium]
MAKPVKIGDIILLHYTARSKDGKIFESSRKRNPLPVKIGAGELVEGLEKALIGMYPGEKKIVTIGPETGYGQYDKHLYKEISKESLPDDINPEIGMQLFLADKKKKILPVVIIEILEKTVKVDANHPLAGKSLVFELEIIEIA